MPQLFNTTPQQPTTVLVGLTLEGTSKVQTQDNLNELATLATTKGIVPIAKFMQQLDRPNPKTWIGAGKVEEIATFVQAKKVDSVLFDDELSPGKVKNLTKLLQCKVWDRTLLILEIFAMRAHTSQAKTQVELAQYQYLLPRLTNMWTHLSRQKGGAGMKGPGEKELETDKRIVQKKIHLLKEKLKDIERQGITQRAQRKKQVNVALVGYTNAGKSTLMHCLSKADVLIEDKLFATLTTTVRKVVLRNIPFLLADTVGFIRKLPHTLIECFKSTLTQVCKADLLLHVVDLSHPNFEEHIAVVQQTLTEIGAGAIPMILVFNKLDNLSATMLDANSKTLANQWTACTSLKKKYTKYHKCPVLVVSASQRINIVALRTLLYKHVVKKHNQMYPQVQGKPKEKS